jgi:hypothetical protein
MITNIPNFILKNSFGLNHQSQAMLTESDVGTSVIEQISQWHLMTWTINSHARKTPVYLATYTTGKYSVFRKLLCTYKNTFLN